MGKKELRRSWISACFLACLLTYQGEERKIEAEERRGGEEESAGGKEEKLGCNEKMRPDLV